MRCKHKNAHALQNQRTCLRFWLKRSLFCLSLAAVATGTIVTSVFGPHDAMEALRKAQKAQLDAPA
jgi:hypothetical protein